MEEFVRKDAKFWADEIEKVGEEPLRPFNDVITETHPPHPDSGYGTPVLEDVTLDGRVCDVYHSDYASDKRTMHRVFIHIKE